MRKISVLIFAVVIIFAFAGCASVEPETPDTVGFRATVIEITDGNMLVEPVEGSFELNSSDRIVVPMKNMEASPEPQVGDIVNIIYNGEILESYPASLGEVFHISVER